MPIKTKTHGWLMKCPTRGLQNHTRKPLILQAEPRVSMLAEKVNFTGHIYNREKLHVLWIYPIPNGTYFVRREQGSPHEDLRVPSDRRPDDA
jgi:hypothetical protein